MNVWNRFRGGHALGSRLRARLGFAHLVLALGALTVALCAWGVVWGLGRVSREFPDVGRLRSHFAHVEWLGPKAGPRMTLVRSRPAEWVSLDQVATQAVWAILVSEDGAFYQHEGYDAGQIREAIGQSLRAGTWVRGASTITQQVVKNVFLNADRTLWRKFKELILAVRLERSVGKRRILETYLNVAEFGLGLYGVSAAARHYFGKTPAELGAKEGAFLAMLLPSPKKYSVSFRQHALTPYAQRTIASILSRLVQLGRLSEEERALESTRRLAFERQGAVSTPAGESEESEPELEAEPSPEVQAEPVAPSIPPAATPPASPSPSAEEAWKAFPDEPSEGDVRELTPHPTAPR